jgi:hypothetical protein
MLQNTATASKPRGLFACGGGGGDDNNNNNNPQNYCWYWLLWHVLILFGLYSFVKTHWFNLVNVYIWDLNKHT